MPSWGHAWRIGFLLGVGAIVSAGIAYIAPAAERSIAQCVLWHYGGDVRGARPRGP
ncbi:MAG TPA: hypothetical protein VG106_05615 [Vicinamibacterales bacterium]|nr:hypothetical protein [Vicinamibacterales bacterium]